MRVNILGESSILPEVLLVLKGVGASLSFDQALGDMAFVHEKLASEIHKNTCSTSMCCERNEKKVSDTKAL